MPHQAPGLRHTAIATKSCRHGQLVTEDNFVGAAFKSEQIGRFVDPVTTPAVTIDVAETFEMELGGILEAPATGNLVAADTGDLVFIRESDNLLTIQGGASGGTNEVQVLTLANATGGTFPIGFLGDTTPQLPFNVSAAAMQTALEALPSVDPGDLSVSGSPIGPYTITFLPGGQYGGENVPQITTSNALLTGSSPTITPSTSQAGAAPGPGMLPVGVVDSIDTTRDTDVVRINASHLNAFALRA